MSRICLFALFGAFLLSIQGCGAIEMGFSMDLGSGEMGVDCQYTLGDDFSFDESLSADPVEQQITDRKEVSGEGDLDLIQSFQSSGGDSGQSLAEAEGAGRVQLASESRIDQEGISLSQTGSMSGDYGNMELLVWDREGTNGRAMTTGTVIEDLEADQAASINPKGISLRQKGSMSGDFGNMELSVRDREGTNARATTAGSTLNDLEADQTAGTGGSVFAGQTSRASGFYCLALAEAWWDGPGLDSRGTFTWGWANGNLAFQGGVRGDSQLLESYKSSQVYGLGMVHGSVAGNYQIIDRENPFSGWMAFPGYATVRSMNAFNFGTSDAVSYSRVDADEAIIHQRAQASGQLFNWVYADSGDGSSGDEDSNFATDAILNANATPTTADAEVI